MSRALLPQIVGLREAFTIRDTSGKPTLSYLQISGIPFGDRARRRQIIPWD
jgi:hypothetical protein